MNNKSLAGYKKLAVLIFLFIVVTLFRNYAFDIVTVSGNSMNDFYFQGDVLIAKADTSDIERYDVVVAQVEGQKIIKRVIALPGETIHIQNGKVYINGEEVIGAFALNTDDAGIAKEPYILGKDEYFLMGDNRSQSYDSRNFGGVNIKEIKSVVMFKI